MNPCEDPACDCPDHISASSHVPCCPVHNLPLVQASPGYGRCLASQVGPVLTHIGGRPFQSTKCRSWREADWRWLPRSRFNGDDLPPHNGWQPPEYDKDVKRYRLDVVRNCRDCGGDMPHLDVGHTSICLRCGYGRWLP